MPRGMRVGEESIVRRGVCAAGPRPDQMMGGCRARPVPSGSQGHSGAAPTHVLQLFLVLGCAEHAREIEWKI